MLHEWKHYNKTALSKWAGAIKTSILKYPREVNIVDLAHALTDGNTVILGHLEYSRKEKEMIKSAETKIGASSRHWKKQQLFAVDIDNHNYKQGDAKYITIDKAIKLCKDKKCPPAFIYTTYSHKEEHHKFRVVFASDTEIDILDKRTKLIESIFEVFAVNGECLVDSKCSDPARLFYPGKELVYTDYEATINPDDITKRLSPTYKLEVETTTTVIKRSPKGLPPTNNRTIKLLRNGKYDAIQKEVANRLIEAGKPYQDWVYKTSSKSGIVTILYIIKDYFPDFAQDPLSPVFIRDPDDYYDLAQQFPLDKLLDCEVNQHISCVLPGHDDKVGSARIERHHDTGEYIYHCYGCMGVNQYYDVFTLLEHAVGWSHAKSKEFINFLLNMEFETEWQKEKKKEITEFQDYVMDTQFQKRFPFLYKELKISNALEVFTFILGEARRRIYDRLITNSEKPIFFTGIKQLKQRMLSNNISTGVSDSSLQRKLKFITKLNLLEVIADESLPIEFIKDSHRRRQAKNYRYRINYYAIPEFSLKLLADAEEIAKEMKGKNIRRRYYSRQSELWANGKEEADKQYVQDRDIDKSKKTIMFYEKYKSVALDLLERGYVTEKEILNHRRIRGLKMKKELSATVMPQLLQEFNLQVVRYNKYYKELFQINQETLKFGSSKIIVREKDVHDKKRN